jgi:hypothetical protein
MIFVKTTLPGGLKQQIELSEGVFQDTSALYVDAPFPQFLSFLLGTLLASEFGARVFRPVVVFGFRQTVASGDSAAINAFDILPYFPLIFQYSSRKDEPVHPEENKTTDQVGDGGGEPINGRTKDCL